MRNDYGGLALRAGHVEFTRFVDRAFLPSLALGVALGIACRYVRSGAFALLSSGSEACCSSGRSPSCSSSARIRPAPSN